MKSIILSAFVFATLIAFMGSPAQADDIKELETKDGRFGPLADGLVKGNATEGISTDDDDCRSCSAPCQDYCCPVPPTLYCYYDGECWCVS